MHFFFAAEKVHTQERLTFLYLTSHPIHWIFEDSKGIDGPVEIHDLATHCDEHSSQENPHFLFHFLSLHERRVKVYLLKLKRSLRTVLALQNSGYTGWWYFRMDFFSDFVSIVVKGSLPAIQTKVRIPSERMNLSLKFLNPILKIVNSSFSV